MQEPKQSFSSVKSKILSALLNYCLIVAGVLSFTGISQWIIVHSGLNYDFENLLNLDLATYLSLVGIIGLIILLFYATYILNIRVKNLSLNNWSRFSCLLFSVLLSIPVYIFTDFGIAVFPYYLSLASYLFLADLFIDKRETSIIWIIFWMITLCCFATILLFNSYVKFDLNKRVNFAKSLVSEKDDQVVKELRDFEKEIDEKDLFGFLDSIPHPLKIHKVEFNQIIGEIIQSYDHIDQSSKPIFNAFDKYENAMVYDQFTTKAFYDDFIKNSIALDTDIFFDPVSDTYLLRKFKDLKYHPDGPFSIYLEFMPSYKLDNPETLLKHTFQKYNQEPDYAVYVNGFLKNTNSIQFSPQNDKAKLLKNSSFENYTEGNVSNLVYKYDNSTTVHVQSEFARIIKPISLFSFLFILLGIVLSGIALVNTKWPFLPDHFLLKLSNISSLRRRIQLSVIVLTILSFIAIGITTLFYFGYLSTRYDQDLKREKNIAITADLNARIQNIDVSALQNEVKPIKNYTDSKSKEELLNRKIASYAINALETSIHDISKTHLIDLHLYDSDGKLINSSAPKLFELGFLPNQMSSPLQNFLSYQNKIHEAPKVSSIGKLNFLNIYIPIRFSSQAKNIAYLQLLHTPQVNTRNNVTDFVGTLLNVYVFLFLLAGAIALAVANSITKPILVLGEQIKNFKLGRKNKKLEWDSEDELGELIRSYNNMSEQLDESAMLIAKTERDSAWREMAKQVAHEIKNPLTPMKLSIQYMQRAIASSAKPEDLVDRVSNTLIEQIDNLSQIASEFSNFGTMPKGNNEKIILNEIVETIHDLFRKRDDMDIFMTEPLDEIYVFADRNHLIRILNNIVKNAIQAIPTDRRGKIDLNLYKKNELAVISVQDNGMGISDAMKDKVFTPNFTTKSSGTGLGLAIAANMIESFNGRIRFTTKENKGTTFFIEIPLMHIRDNFENVERVSLEVN